MKKTLLLDLILLIFLLGGIIGISLVINPAIMGIDTIQDKTLSLSVHKTVYTTTDTRLQKLQDALIIFGVHIYLIDDESINAFTDGKDVYLFSGLVNKISPDAIYMVVGHELGHIKNLHSAKSTIIINEYIENCKILYGENICEQKVMKDPKILSEFRKFEFEADMNGFEMARRAGLNSRTCDELFNLLIKNSANTPEGLSTHPSNSKRLEQCREYIVSGKLVYSPDYSTKTQKIRELLAI